MDVRWLGAERGGPLWWGVESNRRREPFQNSAFEALESLRILRQAFRKEFERYTAPQASVFGFVHDPHPPAA